MFFETSAQSGEKVEEMFKIVGKKIVSKIESKEINPDSESVNYIVFSHTVLEEEKNQNLHKIHQLGSMLTYNPQQKTPKRILDAVNLDE